MMKHQPRILLKQPYCPSYTMDLTPTSSRKEVLRNWMMMVANSWTTIGHPCHNCDLPAPSYLLALLLSIRTTKPCLSSVNTVEIYNRQRTLVVHRETFVNKKEMAALSSLPPIDTKYYNTWVTIIGDTDGSKLVVETKTLNALITSSLRIDSVHQASIGGVISHFDLDDSTALTTSVFLDNESIEKASILASDLNASKINRFDLRYKRRQLRSKF